MHRILVLAFLFLMYSGAQGAWAGDPAEAVERPLEFSRDIQPILAKHCLVCHGPDEAEAGLRLDLEDQALAILESGHRAIVANDAEASELMHRVSTLDESERMPPEGEPLSSDQIALLRRWIEQGATFQQHWSYRPVHDPPLPTVSNPNWTRSPIDHFVLARLERADLAPSPAADRPTLIKRLYYDLIGLPPSPDEVDAFVDDTSAEAYESLVDRLLSSRHFGERWGRHWLDKARYADSDGYEKDNPRPHAWRYRDWVIDAINDDMPYDQFTIEQLAGDLLTNASPQQQLATAFHRQTLTNTEGGTDQEQFRVEATFDRTETTATVWMGLTMTCARCHSHKYDQIPQREYYELFAFFNTANDAKIEMPRSERAMAQYQHDKHEHDAAVAELAAELAVAKQRLQPAVAAWQAAMSTQLAAAIDAPPSQNVKTTDATEASGTSSTTKPNNASADADKTSEVDASMLAINALRTPPEKRTDDQTRQIADYVTSFDPQVRQLSERLETLRSSAPKPPVMPVDVMQAGDRATHVLSRGDFLQPGDEVTSGILNVLNDVHPLEARQAGQPADRLDLALWLTNPNHPLTPRVTVNQVWAHLFGRGIVPTLNDLGVRGEAPTHPELLDWLAYHFPRDMDWSLKTLIKQIVCSATYRQASRHRPELQALDPTNRLLARQNRLRVEAEIVRDLHLAVAGLLSDKVGGPSVFPPLPSGVAELSYANNFKWTNSEGEDRYRRGIYTFFKRTSPHPTLISFDCPDSNTTRLMRDASNTPLQALVTLNNDVFTEAAQRFAQRVLTQEFAGDDADDEKRLSYALRMCTARRPSAEELARFVNLLTASRDYYATSETEAEQLTQRHRVEGISACENAAWVATLRIMMNLDELIVRE